MDNNKMQACQICEACELIEVSNFSSFPRITSDCRSFESGGQIFVCNNCGGVQKLPSDRWLREIGAIYSDYEAYYQSDGDEQMVFDRIKNEPCRRSDVIIKHLIANKRIGLKGSAIDVGCGNGATINAMSRALTGWSFSGYDIDDRSLPDLLSIPRFKKLYIGTLRTIDKQFDLVTMVHSLEHFAAPGKALEQLLPVIGNGKIFIEVPNMEENPFDILIADHLMHFSPHTLSIFLRRIGFTPTIVATDWVPKEISLLALRNKKQKDHVPELPEDNTANKVFDRISAYIDWLHKTVNRVSGLIHGGCPFGIFGTSIAATWLASTLSEGVDFFVDEDPSRIGKEHMGKPIFSPSQVPAGAKVYFSLAPSLAGTMAARLRSPRFKPILPPPLNVI